MSVPAIQTALQQLQALKSEVTTPRLAVDLNVQPGAVTAHTAATPGSFAGELKTSLERINQLQQTAQTDRKSTRLNSSHVRISYAVFCLKKKKKQKKQNK